jgi:hypothetical protein
MNLTAHRWIAKEQRWTRIALCIIYFTRSSSRKGRECRRKETEGKETFHITCRYLYVFSTLLYIDSVPEVLDQPGLAWRLVYKFCIEMVTLSIATAASCRHGKEDRRRYVVMMTTSHLKRVTIIYN